MTYLVDVLSGGAALFQPAVLGFMVLGFLIGTFFGAVPGLTAVLAIALLLPFTYSLDPVSALVMCASIFMAGMYAGSITATTVNIPGAPSSVMTAIEGYRLMQRGEGANALGHAAFASMLGGAVGAVLLLVSMPITAELALLIKTPGKFSLILFALVVIVVAQRGEVAKASVAAILGAMIATIGVDVMQPVPRFAFGTETLVEGIDLMPLIIGTFAISEIMIQAQTRDDPALIAAAGRAARALRRRDFVPKWREIREIGLFTYAKSALIGYFVGVLPGAGGSMAAFVSYAEAMRVSKSSGQFGKGSREGIAAAECANNSMCGGAFVPMLMFGIPGDPTTAVVLGVLVINGLQPGPQLLTNQTELIGPMIGSLFFSALVLIPLSLFLFGPFFVRIVSISRPPLYTAIALVALVGAYVATTSIVQMALTLVFGVLAFILRRAGYPTVTLLLGFILGPSLEEYLRRSLSLSKGDPTIFLTSPDSLAFLALTVVFVVMLTRPRRPAPLEPA
ncbi:tricarboxylate transporter [Acuticoccus sediminis]|uniref:Tricarboxylate transporter n=1 Tax=Acuticoccus sediminis TaxID=2184697 RepID=A0A8B2NJW2_9HYPH|nr:tripartite tricarboxylate transporter permease [Acuticoccus sediminis]RAH99914.1 tricarboxylate transporter [Acuticoccus sediminis]